MTECTYGFEDRTMLREARDSAMKFAQWMEDHERRHETMDKKCLRHSETIGRIDNTLSESKGYLKVVGISSAIGAIISTALMFALGKI